MCCVLYFSTLASAPILQMRGDQTPSRSSTRADLRLEVDELEAIVRDKCKNHQTEVQKKFRDNDPQGYGTVTK